MDKITVTNCDRGFNNRAKELIRVVNEGYIPKCKLCGSAHVVKYGHRDGLTYSQNSIYFTIIIENNP